MNDLQKTELEILKERIEICNRHSLIYYLVCGSALGAVKYGGFIPWDDDIDVAMPRDDYERFLSCAAEELPAWCFLQNARTEPLFCLLGSKLRDSRTTMVEKMFGALDINHGVFIDLFPLDGRPENGAALKKLTRRRNRFEAARRVRLEYSRFSGRNLLSFRCNLYYLLFHGFGLFADTGKEVKRYEDELRRWRLDDSKLWCNYANSISNSEYAPREQYGDGTWALFEGLRVRVPADADSYLTQKYGDWRADLPLEEQKGHHRCEILDLEHPYTDYRFPYHRCSEQPGHF